MRVLVTGATGFIGVEVARQLADSGCHPRLMVRRISRAPLVASLDAEIVFGDLRSRPALRRAVRDVDTIIHLAGRATFEPYDRLAPTLVHATRTLVDEAIGAGVQRIVFGSSAFVYPGEGGVIDEHSPIDPRIDYGRAKVDAEAVLSDHAAAAGLDVATLRLPHVYGPQSLLFGMIRSSVVPFPGAGDNHFAHLHVADAAAALIGAAHRGLGRQALPIADEGSFTWNEFFEVLTSYAPDVRVVHLPMRASMVGASLAGKALGALGPTMVSADTIRGWNQDVRIDSTAAWSLLGAQPNHPTILDGIPATLNAAVSFRWRHPVWDRS